MSRQRLFAAACATLGACALLLQLWLNLRAAHTAGVTEWRALWRYLGYFTILTNLLAVLALSAWAAAPFGTRRRFASGVEAQTATAVAIVMVAVIYHLLLSHLWRPEGWQWVADQLLHTAMPALFALHWWIAVPKAGLRWSHLPACLPYPVLYAAYLLLRGAADGWYPYPFVDVNVLGDPRVAVNAVAILAAFVVLAGLLIALGRWQARQTSQVQPAK